MNRICVFAGSNPGNHPDYEKYAIQLGKQLATRGIDLVYGGSKKGLMGRVADTVLSAGGCVIGVMPTRLFEKEDVHKGLTQLYETHDMHERKAKMSELADAFIALPGGFGTFEEIFEVVSWGHLGIHKKPIALLNIAGYYEPLCVMVENGVKNGFIPADHAKLLMMESDPSMLLDRLSNP